MSMETEICAIIDALPIASLVGNRIMSMDFRAAGWDTAVNYLNQPITVMDSNGYLLPSIAVDRTGLDRSLVLRGAGKFYDAVDIWVYGPRGIAGYTNAVAMMMEIQELHQRSLPNRQMMMLRGTIGPLNDGKNLLTNISFQLTRVMEDTNGQ